MREQRRAARDERGMAVLGALLLVVIVLGLAAAVGARGAHTIARSSALSAALQASELGRDVERAASRELVLDRRRGPTDDAGEPWATRDFVVADARGRAEAHLRDLQGLFNLTALSFAPANQGGDGTAPAAGGADADSRAGPDAPTVDADSAAEAAQNRTPPLDADSAASAALEAQAPAPGAPITQPATPPAGAAGANGSQGAHGNGATTAADVLGMNALAAVPGMGTLLEGSAPAQPGGNVSLSPQQVAVARFALLLQALNIDASVLPAVLDWLDADGDTRFPNGAEDDYYGRLEPPYRSANRAFADVSELRLVRGVTDEVFAKLRPFVTVLPADTAINLNTAPAEILMSLAPGIDRGTADLLVHTRQAQPFHSVAEFTALPPLAGRPLVSQGLGVASDFFALGMQVVSGRSEFGLRTRFVRAGGGTQVDVLDRRQGYFDE